MEVVAPEDPGIAVPSPEVQPVPREAAIPLPEVPPVPREAEAEPAAVQARKTGSARHEMSPIFTADAHDPDFEPTERNAPELAPIANLPPPVQVAAAVADEERSISTTLIRMVRGLFGGGVPEPTPPIPPPVHTATFPVDMDDESYGSRQDGETAQQVREALARMARGEDPFPDQ